MRNLQRLLAGRVSSIRRRVLRPIVKRPRTGENPAFTDLSAKLARARDQVRGARHGRRTG
jgi:hypothetical protein